MRADPTGTCYVEWGGWHWQATAPDRAEAVRRLLARLNLLDPFHGGREWGDPGHKIGELNASIPATTRAQLEELDRLNGSNE